MAAAIAILVISLGAIVAGWGYAKTARRMRAFATTRGTVLTREVVPIPGGAREGRYGKGGGHMPKVTYRYMVGGVAYTSDRYSYAYRGFKTAVVEQQLAAIPDEVDVYYDPAKPQEAYLVRHTAAIGNLLLAGGACGVIVALIALVA